MHSIFCPLCGSRLTARTLGDEGDVPYCEHCARPFFDSFSSCVICAAAAPDGRIAVLKNAGSKGPFRGLVAGYIKPGESAEEAAVREIAEELGQTALRVIPVRTYWFARGDQLMIGMIVHVNGGQLTPSCELDSAEWMTAEDALACMHPGGPAYQLTSHYIAHPEQHP